MYIETIILIILGALICEIIDSSMGMLYGTILSPVLIIAGFNPLVVVPSILFSQAIGGLIAARFHHKYQNVDFKPKSTDGKSIFRKIKEIGFLKSFREGFNKDLKIVFVITILGLVATIGAAIIAINIPKTVLKTYIGILVLSMGILLLSKINFKFSWKKIMGIGIVGSFNKGLSGGGFGPVTTSGQIVAGNSPKNSIAVTTLAEAPICIAGFLTYLFINGLSNWNLLFYLVIGSAIGAMIGPYFTAKFKSEKKLRMILGIIVVLLGVWTLAKTWII